MRLPVRTTNESVAGSAGSAPQVGSIIIEEVFFQPTASKFSSTEPAQRRKQAEVVQSLLEKPVQASASTSMVTCAAIPDDFLRIFSAPTSSQKHMRGARFQSLHGMLGLSPPAPSKPTIDEVWPAGNVHQHKKQDAAGSLFFRANHVLNELPKVASSHALAEPHNVVSTNVSDEPPKAGVSSGVQSRRFCPAVQDDVFGVTRAPASSPRDMQLVRFQPLYPTGAFVLDPADTPVSGPADALATVHRQFDLLSWGSRPASTCRVPDPTLEPLQAGGPAPARGHNNIPVTTGTVRTVAAHAAETPPLPHGGDGVPESLTDAGELPGALASYPEDAPDSGAGANGDGLPRALRGLPRDPAPAGSCEWTQDLQGGTASYRSTVVGCVLALSIVSGALFGRRRRARHQARDRRK